MANEQALIGLGFDLSDLVKQAAQIPKLVGKDSDKAIKQVQRMAIRASKDIEKVIKKQAREQAKAAKAAAREAERAQREAYEAGKALVELSGVSADRFDKLRAVMAGMSTPIGQIAIGAAAAGLAVAGMATAVVGATGAAVALTRTARDLVEELEPLSEALGIGEESIESIHAANDAMDGAMAAGQALVVLLTSELAPAVERGATVLVKLGLMGRDALNTIGGGTEVVAQGFAALGKAAVQALTPSLSLLLDMAEMAERVGRATGLDSFADKIGAVRKGLRELPLSAVDVAFQGIEAATSDYDAEAKKLVDTIKNLRIAKDRKRKSTEKDTEAEKAAREAAKLAAAAMRDYTHALEAARQPFVDRSEIANLRRLQSELVEAAAAAVLTTEQSQELARALDDIAHRIETIQRNQAGMFDPLQAQLDTLGVDAYDAVSDMGGQIDQAMQDIPWGRIWGRSLLATAKESALKAADIIGTFAGGALSDLANPAALFQAAAEGGRSGGREMAKQATEFVTELAKNIGPFLQGLASGADEFLEALLAGLPRIVVGLLKSVDDIVLAIIRGLARGAVALARTIARQVRRAVTPDRLERGGGRRRRFSDTPGPVYMPRGGTVDVAPGDTVVAARTERGMRQQVGGAASTPGEVSVVIDWRDGGARLGVSRATSRYMNRAGVGRPSTGRKNPYG